MIFTRLSFTLLILLGFTESEDTSFNQLYPIINEYVRGFPAEFRNISEDRRYRLNEIVYYLEEQEENNDPWQLLFISTNQSAVGQMAQVWSKAAAFYFGFTKFESFSGGLKPMEISVNMIKAMEKAGFTSPTPATAACSTFLTPDPSSASGAAPAPGTVS